MAIRATPLGTIELEGEVTYQFTEHGLSGKLVEEGNAMKIVMLTLFLLLTAASTWAQTTPEFVQIETFGGRGDNSTDNTPALNAAVAYCEANNIRHIHFGIGRYLFLSAPNPFQSGIWIEGMNRSETQLVAKYDRQTAPSHFLKWIWRIHSTKSRRLRVRGE